MIYHGNAPSQGIAIGEILQYRPFVPRYTDTSVDETYTEDELAHYQQALHAAETELTDLIHRMSSQHPEHSRILQAHLDILQDVVMDEEICTLIQSEHLCAAAAIDQVYSTYAEILEASDNTLIAERGADMRDVRLRLLRCLEGETHPDLSSLPKPVILAAHDLLPSDTATLDRDHVLAIVTETGGITSHSAIIARSYGIPALLGVHGVMDCVQNGETVIVDAVRGLLITQPDKTQIDTYAAQQAAMAKEMQDQLIYRDQPAYTKEGTHIQVLANIASANEKELTCAPYVDGVGLFRTEFLYLGRETLPDEQTQYEQYRRVLEAFAPHPVTLRTLDIGGDKELNCLQLPSEENPFLGQRALRLCLANEDLFLTQLRAVLRASVHGKIKLMFPMVSSLDDFRRAKSLLDTAKSQLAQRGESWSDTLELGVMIEIPALAVLADIIAKEVDFASIGTNDLIQYTLAVDRVNDSICDYYQPFHPAVLRLLRYAISSFRRAGKAISVCGELGGNPLAAAALLGMGITSLSMGSSAVASIKELICTLDMDQARNVVNQVCETAATATEAEERLRTLFC